MRRFLTGCVVLLLLLAGLSCISQAQDKVVVIPLNSTSEAFKGDQYLNISFADFVPSNEIYDYQHPWNVIFIVPAGARGYVINEAGTASFFDAAIHLPNSAVISEVTLFANDEGIDSEFIAAYIFKRSLASSDDSATLLATLNSDDITPAGYGQVSAAIANEVVDNQNNYYYISAYIWGTGTDIALYSVRIKYTIP